MESPTVVKPVQMNMLKDLAAVIQAVAVTARYGCNAFSRNNKPEKPMFG
jgi:hypothetical protein